jgi:hypothetical protein
VLTGETLRNVIISLVCLVILMLQKLTDIV